MAILRARAWKYRGISSPQTFRYNQNLRWWNRVAPLAQMDRASGYQQTPAKSLFLIEFKGNSCVFSN